MAKTPRRSRESVAYQETYRQRQPLQTKQDALEVIKPRTRKRRAVYRQQILCIAAVAAVATVMIASQMRLTELTSEVAEQEETLEQLQNEYISLKAEQDRALSLTYVENYAQNVLGMVKMDASSVEYIEMNNPDKVEVTRRHSGIFAALHKCIEAIQAYIT